MKLIALALFIILGCSQIVNAEEFEIDPDLDSRGCAEMVIADSNFAVKTMQKVVALEEYLLGLAKRQPGEVPYIILHTPELFTIADDCMYVGIKAMTEEEIKILTLNRHLLYELSDRFLVLDEELDKYRNGRGPY